MRYVADTSEISTIQVAKNAHTGLTIVVPSAKSSTNVKTSWNFYASSRADNEHVEHGLHYQSSQRKLPKRGRSRDDKPGRQQIALAAHLLKSLNCTANRPHRGFSQ